VRVRRTARLIASSLMCHHLRFWNDVVYLPCGRGRAYATSS